MCSSDLVRVSESTQPARLAGCTLVRRSLWERVGGCLPELRQGEWIEWLDRAMSTNPIVTTVDEVTLHRRIHARNSTRATSGREQYLAVARAALLRKRGGNPS